MRRELTCVIAVMAVIPLLLAPLLLTGCLFFRSDSAAAPPANNPEPPVVDPPDSNVARETWIARSGARSRSAVWSRVSTVTRGLRRNVWRRWISWVGSA